MVSTMGCMSYGLVRWLKLLEMLQMALESA